MADGDLNYKLDTSHMVLSFKEHGENLNRIGEGISAAVEQRMKSEHLKTELITNVSHDIKDTTDFHYQLCGSHRKEVPKKNDAVTGSNPTDRILKRNSGSRVCGSVVTPVPEVEKAVGRSAGGFQSHHRQSGSTPGGLRCIGTVVTGGGEYEQRFSDKKLETIVKQPEETVKVMADGRHLWRVFDNLLNNIYKYAQAGSAST